MLFNSRLLCASTRAVRRGSSYFAAIVMALAMWPADASAQLTRVGEPSAMRFSKYGAAVAYDPVSDVYVIVGVTTTISADVVDASGGLLHAYTLRPWFPGVNPILVINPSVVYSPDVPDFMLMSQHFGQLSGVVLAYPEGTFRPGAAANVYSSGPDIHPVAAYSSASGMFLAVWHRSNIVSGELTDLLGPRYIEVPNVSGAGEVARLPSVEWNPDTNEFGVAYSSSAATGASLAFARVTPTGTVAGRTAFAVGSTPTVTDVAFNPATGRFLAVWFDTAVHAVEIDAAGDVVAHGIVSTNTVDAIALSYNAVSGTFLLAAHGAATGLWAAELNAHGARIGGDIYLSHPALSTNPFYVDAAASTRRAEWSVAFTNTTRDALLIHSNFRPYPVLFTIDSKVFGQIVRTSSTGGGGGGTLTPVIVETPSPPPSSCSIPDPFVALGGGTCYNGGWLPPGMSIPGTSPSSPPPSSSSCATPDPFAAIGGGTCVNGGWLPPGMAAPASTPTGCTTPDPFASIPGMYGVCINGGWVPRLR
jgi:hypothetical protein